MALLRSMRSVSVSGEDHFGLSSGEHSLIIRLSRLGWTQQEIADHPDITVNQARVSQIVNKIDNDKIINLFYNQARAALPTSPPPDRPPDSGKEYSHINILASRVDKVSPFVIKY